MILLFTLISIDSVCKVKKRIALFGSTGSIGIQALDIISRQKDQFEVEVLTAYQNADRLIGQALTFNPNVVVIGDENHYKKVSEALANTDTKVYAGTEAIWQVAQMGSIDLHLMAIVGFEALKPLLTAIENKKPIALANKESLVVAGELIAEKARRFRSPIIPIDSEHSAIFQCLMGEMNNPVEKIVLTASGGPFLDNSVSEMEKAKPDQALLHPNWKMGNKTTIDSASMMNKGLEAIEAKWLFDLKPEQIELLIHPQSIVHSLVYFADGSVKAQLSDTDMRIPIQFAMSYPHRFVNQLKRLDLTQCSPLEFIKPDLKKFRNLALAFEAMEKGGNLPCILNAANEIAVNAFLKNKMGFMKIPVLVEKCMESLPFVQKPTLDDIYETDRLCRLKAKQFIDKL